MTVETNQQELFQAETTWFHIFKTMIDSGDAAKMGGTTFLVYSVIKAHTNYSTGRSFPAHETIAEKSGISVEQVKRCINKLIDMEYVTKGKQGRSNVYTLREKVQVLDGAGRPSAVATWDYLPSTVKAAMADLKNVLMSGDLGGAKIVHIERLQINIGNHNVNINEMKERMSSVTDPELLVMMQGILDELQNGKK
jgi:2-phospho-L-lactate guanylyltransferase (CobY/MobA/RfbA family)